MAAITENQVKQCYDAARAVVAGASTNADALQAVVLATGMNAASASDYIGNVRLLIQPTGRIYARTMKIEETERILGWISRDFGPDAARAAAYEVLRHVEYYAGLATGGQQPTLRTRAESFLSDLPPTTLQSLAAQEFAAVEQSISLSRDDRLARLAAANRKPSHVVILVKAYVRNPDVVAEVLDRAKGVCEGCGKTAPFVRMSNGQPYLEVHHRIPLALDGDDHPDNAAALCPNCHREAHHGVDGARFQIMRDN